MIDYYSFGKIVIDEKTWKNDLLLSWDGLKKKWQRKKGHRVEIADLEDLLSKNPEILIIGKGKPGLMKTTENLRNHLKTNRINLVELSTSKAIIQYNLLVDEGKKVVAGFHLTC